MSGMSLILFVDLEAFDEVEDFGRKCCSSSSMFDKVERSIIELCRIELKITNTTDLFLWYKQLLLAIIQREFPSSCLHLNSKSTPWTASALTP